MTSVVFLSLTGESSNYISEQLLTAGIRIIENQSLAETEKVLTSDHRPVCIVRSQTLNETVFGILGFIRQHKLSTKIIVSAATGSVDDAVRSMKAGVSDFLTGDCNSTLLAESIVKLVPNAVHPQQPVQNSDQITETDCVLIGQSSSICEIRSAVNLVAKSQTTVLITGESGTGKEIVVRLIHSQSSRAKKPFVALNCASLPKDVIENELFGHERGAFTGALIKKPGCFEMANGGTLLFDEIAEMSPETQAKLLRAIETQKFRRLGGKEEIRVDVRMIAATNKNIAAALKSKELREDLYYRLSVIEIFIPPLRERKEDIPLLIDYFLSLFSQKYGKQRQEFSEECLTMLSDYDWPGNVREIKNVIERAIVICPHNKIGRQYLPERIQHRIPLQHITIPLGSSAEEAERILILQTLASAGNNKAKTAKILGLSRKTLHNKLQLFAQK